MYVCAFPGHHQEGEARGVEYGGIRRCHRWGPQWGGTKQLNIVLHVIQNYGIKRSRSRHAWYCATPILHLTHIDWFVIQMHEECFERKYPEL